MNYKYRPDEYETKLIVLYTIKSLKMSPTYQILSQIITGAADINYFEIQHYIEELTELKSIESFHVDEQEVFSLTDAGEEMCEFFSSGIPASIREKISEAAYVVNNDRSHENRVYADYIPINESEYMVKLGIVEHNLQILNLEMYAGPKDRAKKICTYFKEHTNEFYSSLVDIIDKGKL